jgi:CxxC motif-containing protein (DUF1111 family)
VSVRNLDVVIGAAPLAAVAANAAPEPLEPVGKSITAVNSAAPAPAVPAAIGRAAKEPQIVTTSPRSDPSPADPARNAAGTGTKSPGQKEIQPIGALPVQPRPAPLDDRLRGEMLFAKEWMPDDPMSRGGDGLGPVYNDTSCVACHSLGAPGGAGPESKNVVLMTANPGCGPANAIEQISPGFIGSRTAVLHLHGTDPEYASWRRQFASPDKNQPRKSAADPIQARIRAINERTSPANRLRDRSRGSATINGVTVGFSERNTPALFGSSKIDKVPTEVLLALAANQPERVRGRVSRTRDGKIGRFGWKAQVPSLHEFVRAACANELGLEVAGHSQPASPLAPKEKAKGLDLDESDCNALVAYVRSLPTPVVIDPFGSQGTVEMRDGRRLFDDVGCATCHVASLGEVSGIYSDLLLHNMGQRMSDSGGSYGANPSNSPGAATAREWRTPPLWGYRDTAPYMHDGRALDLEEAVALHDGQGRSSAHQFFELSPKERAKVEAFLKSLVAPTAAAASGIMLAAEMERRIQPDDEAFGPISDKPRRPSGAPRDEQQWRAVERWRLTLEAAKRARVQIPIAESLEKMGKTAGAVKFYREIAHLAAGTKEGRLAAERVAALSTPAGSP